MSALYQRLLGWTVSALYQRLLGWTVVVDEPVRVRLQPPSGNSVVLPA